MKTPNYKHGHTNGRKRTTEFVIWSMMRRRCHSPKCDRYSSYGARGIIVCEKWRNSFLDFFNDMGNRPSMQHTLDRIDINGNYEPSNCQWATAKKQARNKQNSVYITYKGENKLLIEWCEMFGLPYSAILRRIRRGYTPKMALEKPLMAKTFKDKV